MMFGSISEDFANLRHENSCKSSVSRLNTLFRGTELQEKVLPRTHPIQHIRPKKMFGTVLEHFANLRQGKSCKTSVLRLTAIFWCTELSKKFCHEQIQYNRFDPKWCLGVFQRILRTFGTKNHAKLVFRAWKHYFRVPNFRKNFFHEHIQSNLLDRKRYLGVFRSISQTFNTKIHEKVVFRCWKHYFGYRTSGKSFATNTSNVTY